MVNLVSSGLVSTPGGAPQGSALVDLGCPVVVCGDCNANGSVTIVDALLAAQHGASLITLTGSDFSGCNVTWALEPQAGAAVGVLDALILAQHAAGIVPTLTCCLP